MAFTKITHAGIGSTGTVLLENLEVTGVGTFGGSVSVGGTLTYEDVTNVDSVGIITARAGVLVGSGITLSKDGDIFFTGIMTGNGSGLTGVANTDVIFSDKITFPDSAAGSINVGLSSDLQIYHSGTFNRSYIQATGTNHDLSIAADEIALTNSAISQTLAKFISGASVELYENGTKVAETTSGGFNVEGVTYSNGLDMDDSHKILLGTDDDLEIFHNGSNAFIKNGTGQLLLRSGTHTFENAAGSTEYARIDASGRVVIGHTSNIGIAGHNGRFQLHGTDYDTATMSIVHNGNASHGPFLFFASQRSGSPGGSTVLQNNDSVGTIRFHAGDGTDMASYCASIQAKIDGAPGSNDVPGRLTFSTTADGASSPTERLRITSGGEVGINNSSPDSLFKLDVNGRVRLGNNVDGIILENGASNANVSNAASIRRHSSTGNLHITAGTSTARNLIFGTKTSGAEIARFTDTGLCFNGDTAAANALDDYEEGSAVPDFANADNSIVTVNRYTYTKVGRLVHFEAKFTVGSNNDGSGFGFSLPVGQAGSRETVIPAISTRSSPNNPFVFVINANQSYAYAQALQGYGTGNTEYVDFAGSIILVSGTYEGA